MIQKDPADKVYGTMEEILNDMRSRDYRSLFGTDEFLHNLERRGDGLSKYDGGSLIIGEGRTKLDFIGKGIRPMDGSVLYTRYIPVSPTGWDFDETGTPDEYPRDFAHMVLYSLGLHGAGQAKNYSEFSGAIHGLDYDRRYFKKNPTPLPYIKGGVFYPLKAIYEHPVDFSVIEERQVQLPNALLTPASLKRLSKEGYCLNIQTLGEKPHDLKGKAVWTKTEESVIKGIGRDVLLIYLDKDCLDQRGRPTKLYERFSTIPKKYSSFIIGDFSQTSTSSPKAPIKAKS